MAKETDTSELQSELAALKQDLSKVRTDVRGLAETLVDLGKGSAQKVRSDVEGRVESSLESLQEHIEKRPVTTVAVAFAVGLVAGKLFTLNRH